MLHPGVLGSLLRLDAREPVIAQILYAIRDPIDVLLASQYHLTFDARALRARGAQLRSVYVGVLFPGLGDWPRLPISVEPSRPDAQKRRHVRSLVRTQTFCLCGRPF